MQKEINILGSPHKEEYKSFKDRIFKLSHAVPEEYRPDTLKVCLTTKPTLLVYDPMGQTELFYEKGKYQGQIRGSRIQTC